MRKQPPLDFIKPKFKPTFLLPTLFFLLLFSFVSEEIAGFPKGKTKPKKKKKRGGVFSSHGRLVVVLL